MSDVLVREFCAVAFRVNFPDDHLVSPEYRGRRDVTVTTSDGEEFSVRGEKLTGFDEGFAKLYFEFGGAKKYYSTGITPP